MTDQHAEAVRLLEDLLRRIEADPHEHVGGMAEDLRDVRALLVDARPRKPYCLGCGRAVPTKGRPWRCQCGAVTGADDV